MRLLAVACLGAALGATAADLDAKLRLQNLRVRLERDRDESAAQVKAAEAAVARNQDLVSRAASGSREAKVAAGMALEFSRQNLAKRKRRHAEAEAMLNAVQRVVDHPRFGAAPIQAVPLAVEGAVKVLTRNGRMVALGSDHPWLEPGDQVITGANERVSLELAAAEGSLQIGPNSKVGWAPETVGQVLELAAGRVNFWILQVQHSKIGKHHHQVRTPAAVYAVRGTRFELVVEPDGATLCTVTEGTVEVSDREGRVTRAVTEGQRIRVPKDHVPGRPLPEPERFDVTPLPGREARP
jgi:hypothetical protein